MGSRRECAQVGFGQLGTDRVASLPPNEQLELAALP